MKFLIGLLTVLWLSACSQVSKDDVVKLAEKPAPDVEVAAVQNLQVLNTSQTEITLRWSDEHHAAGYRIRRDGEQVAELAAGLFTYTDSHLITNKEYRYEVVAINDLGRESLGESITVITLANSAAEITTSIDQLTLLSTLGIDETVAQINASDDDGHSLGFSINNVSSDVNLGQYFAIDNTGRIHVISDLSALAGKVFTLQVEVTDGLSISSMSFQLGVIAVLGNSELQGLSRNVYSHSSISDDLAALKALPSFPDSPSSSSIEPSFQSPSNVGSHYGQRMLGYLVPPTTGEYQFWIAADDSAELSLGSDHNIETLDVIASVPSWTNPEQWNRHSAQQSIAIQLEAGKAYAIQALMVEGGGGDHLAVAWQGPGINQAIIGNEYLRLPVDFEAPSKVTKLSWLKTAEDAVTLEWQAAQDNIAIDHYDIYNGSQKIASSQELSLKLSGLLSATRYDLTVRAVDGAGNSSTSSELVSIVIDDFIAPSIVTGLTASELTHSSVSLLWQVATDERNKPVLYRIYQQGNVIAQTYATDYKVTGLQAASDYSFQIEAVDEAGNVADLSTALPVTSLAIADMTPIFAHSQYEFILANNSPVNQHFAQLSYRLAGAVADNSEESVSLAIVSGNDAQHFVIANRGAFSGALSLNKTFTTTDKQVFNLVIEAELAGKKSQTEVTVYAIPAENLQQKGALQQVWTGQSGSNLDDLNQQASIASQQVLSDVKSPTSMGNNYGQKVSAYLTVPFDGVYNFWIASDDASELKISPDASAEKAELVARITGYTSENNWSNSSQVKTDLALKAGQLYYLEVLHKEGGGGDHMSVAWQGTETGEAASGLMNKALLANDYILPSSNFKPAPMKMETAFQSNFAQQGNQLQLDLLVSELNAGHSVRIYYGEMDAGQTSIGWQHSLLIENLTQGQHSINLENINPGSRYYIRIETLGAVDSSWSDDVLIVDTVVIDDSKTLGEALPQNLELTVLVNEVEQTLVMEKHSLRSPNFQLLTFDSRRLQEYQALVPMPEVRTYRGTIANDEFAMITGVVDSKGMIHLSAWGGDSRQWGQTLDISHLINADALGNSEYETTELKLDFVMPDPIDNRYYQPNPGLEFHNHLSRVAFTFRNTQFMNQAEGNLINAIAQMEGHINELDYVWAQKTGLRWDIGTAVIEQNGAIEEASQARPAGTDATTFRMTFQDPRNGGYCWGGGDWLGCVANYTMNWGFTHEVGHNFGLGHGEQTDNNNQIQQPSTHMGNMQARKTTARLQKGSKFRPAQALTNPMLPATFKDYLTVYQDQAGNVSPLANDYDANGDVLTIVSFEATTLAGGSVTQTGHVLTYTPPAGFVGVDQFSYVASDGQFKTRGPVQIQVLANGLTAHWDMESLTTVNNSEWVSDLSGMGNDLSAPNLSAITPAASLADVQTLGPNNQSGQALTIPLVASSEKALDAIGHNLLPHKLDPGHKSFTASMWFKYSAIDGNKHLIGKSSAGPNNMQYGGWEIRSEGNKLEMQVSFRDRLMQTNWAQVEQEAALVDGSWHHVVMVIDRENHQLHGYLDGVALTSVDLPIGQGPITAAMNSSGYGGGSPFRVGGHTGVDCIDGASEGDPQVCTVRDGQAFDNVKLYHKALTSAEVLALYNE
jgi:chitodextrinase